MTNSLINAAPGSTAMILNAITSVLFIISIFELKQRQQQLKTFYQINDVGYKVTLIRGELKVFFLMIHDIRIQHSADILR